MSVSSSSNSPGARKLIDSVGFTLTELIAGGCQFRILGPKSVELRVPRRLSIKAVQTWLGRHEDIVIEILVMADRLEVCEAELDLKRLYFVRWLVNRERLGRG